MSEFDTVDGLQPVSYRRRNTKAKKKNERSYIWAVMILFILVGLLCANSFKLIEAYKEMDSLLGQAYNRLETTGSVKNELLAEKEKVEELNNKLQDELQRLKNENEKLAANSKEAEQAVESYMKENKSLASKNKVLTDDNIALQNSLKQAASVGIKPQSYSLFEELEPRETLARGKYIGKFLGTAYTPSKEECGNNKGITNSGEPIVPGVTIAIDTKYWPFGTVFYIKGLGYVVAMDTGSAIKGKYRFDFSVLDKNFANKLGSRKWEVYLVKLGNGSVKPVNL